MAPLSLTGGAAAAGGGGRLRARPAARLAGVRGARERVGRGVRAIGRRALAVSVAAPGGCSRSGSWSPSPAGPSSTRTEVISDLRELVPGDLPELAERRRAPGGDRRLGRGRGRRPRRRPHRPRGRRLDGRVQAAGARDAGFGGEATACAEQDTQLCPYIALPDLFGDRAARDRERVEGVLDLLPPYFLAAVRQPRRGPTAGTAMIPFGIKVMPFDEQKELIDSIRAEIDPPGTENDPPEGVEAEVVGLPVLAADANSALESNRYLLTLAGLARRGAGAARDLPLGAAGAGAAGPDRARDRLVVARAWRSPACR